MARNRHRFERWTSKSFAGAAGVLTACALAASLVGAASADARSQGFYIYNLTAKPMKLKTIQLENDAKFDREPTSPNPPKVGDILMPGIDSNQKYDHNHIELERRLVAPFGTARLFYAAGRRDYGALLSTGARRPQCEWFSQFPLCTTDPPSIYFLDAPGTTDEIPSADPGTHAEYVQRLCTDPNLNQELVTCEFEPTQAPDHTAFGSPHAVGLTVPNCAEETGNPTTDAEETIDVDLQEEDKTGQENSFGVKTTAEAEFGAFVEKLKLAIETSYKGTWSTEHTFKKKVSYKVRPGYIGWTVGENPVIRVRGDLTLKIGNTTLLLKNVYIDNPDGSREGEVQWRPFKKKMTAEERKIICKEGDEPVSSAPASWAKITQRGTNAANTMYGGRESTTLIGKGGNDILLGGAGDDKLYGGPGNDVYRGGPGSDTIVDHHGSSRVWTGTGGPAGPDFVDVKDGQADDTVICREPDATVHADPGDRVRGC